MDKYSSKQARKALFVGINQYRDNGIDNLQYAQNDAIELHGLFKNTLGYESRYLLDPSADELLDELELDIESLAPGDLYLLFFAGHGQCNALGEDLLLCRTTRVMDLDRALGCVARDSLEKRLRQKQLQAVTIYDTCRSDQDSHTRGSANHVSGQSFARDIARRRPEQLSKDSPDHTVTSLTTLFACSQGEQAQEIVEKQQGLFTCAMMQLIRDAVSSGTIIQVNATFLEQLQNQMRSFATSFGLTTRSQTPQLNLSLPIPSLWGQAYPSTEPANSSQTNKTVEASEDWRQEEEKWQKVREKDSLSAYRVFLDNYPESLYRDAARKAMARLEVNQEDIRQEPVVNQDLLEPVKNPNNLSADISGTKLIPVLIPDLSGAKDVDVVELLVKTGDRVKEGDSLVVMESDKATMEIPATMSGIVHSVNVKVDDQVNVGDLLVELQMAKSIESSSTTTQITDASYDLKNQSKVSSHTDVAEKKSKFSFLPMSLLVIAVCAGGYVYLTPSQSVIPEMVIIPAGEFMMGSKGGNEFETPVHKVSVPAFKMSKYEITFDQWEACFNAGGCSHRPLDEGWGRGNRPVVNVSWGDIKQQYIPWLNRTSGRRFRLPSEAEWEYAARANSTTKFYWGNTPSSRHANGDETKGWPSDGYKNTAPVGSFIPNEFGLYDMTGNVSEWIEDCWHFSYADAPSNGAAWAEDNCDMRTARGGSKASEPTSLYSSSRDWVANYGRIPHWGFRLAQDI